MKRGDRVVVVMARNNLFPWQTAPSFGATYSGGPDGPGDTFRVWVEGYHGTVHINGNSSEFVGIHPAPEGAEEGDE